jgi:hypothetical protein
MAFNDIELQRIKKIVGGFCEERIPDHLRSQIRVFYEVRGYDVNIIESRPDFMKNYEWTETPIARLKYEPATFGATVFDGATRQVGEISGAKTYQPTEGTDRGNRERSILRVLWVIPSKQPQQCCSGSTSTCPGKCR